MQRFNNDLGVYGHPGDVTPWDIRFDPSNLAHLERLADGSIAVRVWAEPGLTDGLLVVREGAGVVGHPMVQASEGRRFAFWEAALPTGTDAFECSFAFRSPAGTPVYRVPAGITNAVERNDRWKLDPSTLRFDAPDWAQGAVIYQIFPDRFANGDPDNDPADVEPWDSSPTPRGIWGGDLVGIRHKLGYLQDLGVDLIYLNPVFTSPSNHRYDVTDYYAVDPALGNNDDFAALVSDAHERNMRILLDASFNHVHPGFFAFQDLIRRGVKSPYVDWFEVRDWPVRIKHRPHLVKGPHWASDWLPVWQQQTGLGVEVVADEGPIVEPTYDSWYGVATMPRINLANPGARAYMLDVTSHWIENYGIDGWRMDVARYVDIDFWNDFRSTAKRASPDALLIAEVMGDASLWLQGDRFDATMNYTFRDICLGFLARDTISGPEFLDRIATMLAQYGQAATSRNQNLIGSHDTSRFLTEAGGDRWRLNLATVFQLTMPGAPSIYYGDEIGLEGGRDPGSRGTFPWDHNFGADDTFQLVRSLTRLRRRSQALISGTWHRGLSTQNVISYERRLGRSRLLIIINRGRTKTHIDNEGWKKVAWGTATITDSSVSVAARQAAILTR